MPVLRVSAAETGGGGEDDRREYGIKDKSDSISNPPVRTDIIILMQLYHEMGVRDTKIDM